jgi:hypothetical protein
VLAIANVEISASEQLGEPLRGPAASLALSVAPGRIVTGLRSIEADESDFLAIHADRVSIDNLNAGSAAACLASDKRMIEASRHHLVRHFNCTC